MAIARERLDPADPWLGVKTTERARYDAARAALPAEVHEVLFLNTRGEVCEGTIFNVFVKVEDEFLTPRLGCGLLPGVFREHLLRRGTRARRCCVSRTCGAASSSSAIRCAGSALRALSSGRRGRSLRHNLIRE